MAQSAGGEVTPQSGVTRAIVYSYIKILSSLQTANRKLSIHLQTVKITIRPSMVQYTANR